jgi:MGT family glycosyltransferase
MIYAAAIAAHTEEVPWVALSNSLNPVLDDGIRSELLDTVRWLAPAREALFAKYGMNPGFRGCDVLSPHLTIAFTTREFIGRDVPGVEMVGPSLPPGVRGDETDFPWEKLRPPVIYASFGSQIYHQPQLFRLLIEATQHSGFQLVIAVNELLHSDRLGNLPPHVLACHYAPQLAILPKAAAFVTHGGANSVMEALYFGVPLLISPVCNDQFHQAQFVARAGTGCVLDVQTAKLKEVRDELLGLPHDPGVRAALQRVTPSYQKDGSARAAELIEQMATEDRP